MATPEEKTDKEKWYPGKYIKERRKSSMTPATDAGDHRRERQDSSPSDVSPNVGDSPTLPTTPASELRSKSHETDPSKEGNKKPSGWYPGKYAGRKPPSTSHHQGRSESLRNAALYPVAGSAPRKTVGTVIVKVLGAKYMSATRPSFEVRVLHVRTRPK